MHSVLIAAQLGTLPVLAPLPLNRVPAWKDEQFLALLKQALLNQRREQLQRLYEGRSAAPTYSQGSLSKMGLEVFAKDA